MGSDTSDREKRWRKIWKEERYTILNAIRSASSRADGSGKKGLELMKFADVAGLPPREASDFLSAMINQFGATIYVRSNRIYAHNAPQITSKRHDDLIPFEQVQVFAEPIPLPGVRFGVVSDTHFGSRRVNMAALKAAYHYFQREGIHHVIHAGNILAGTVPSEYKVDLQREGLEAQLDSFFKGYPKYDGITTHFLLGHRDHNFHRENLDPAKLIQERRSDFSYLGDLEADLIFNPEGGRKPFVIRVTNDKLYYTYSVSYQPQKKLENMAGGERPDIWLIGGAQQSWKSRYQGVEIVKLPGLQNQTSRMRHRAYSCHVGFTLMEVVARDKRADLYPHIITDLKQGSGAEGRSD